MPRGDEPLGLVANQFLFENDRLKMWHLDLQPGESSDWHVHDLDYVTVVVEPGKLLREWEDGSTCQPAHTQFFIVETDDYNKLYELFRPFLGIAKADISPVRDLDEIENPLGHVNFTRKHGAHRRCR